MLTTNTIFQQLLEKIKDGSHERKKSNENLVIRTRQDKILDAIANLILPRVEIDKFKQIDIDVENKLKNMSSEEMRKLIFTVNGINRKINRTRLLKKDEICEEALVEELIDLTCHDRTLDANEDIRSTYMKLK